MQPMYRKQSLWKKRKKRKSLWKKKRHRKQSLWKKKKRYLKQSLRKRKKKNFRKKRKKKKTLTGELVEYRVPKQNLISKLKVRTKKIETLEVQSMSLLKIQEENVNW